MELFYRHYGNGEPLIILHGLFGISDNWVSFARRLSDRYEVFIPDQRNHGRSPHHPEFNYAVLVDDLFEFINRHKIHDPVILGHSMGGKVAMLSALEHPDLLKALIVADISLRTYEHRHHHLKMIEAMMGVDLTAAKSRSEVELQLKQKISEERVRQFLMKNLYRRENNEGFAWRFNLDAINRNLSAVFEGINTSKIFTKPALFIRGDRSDYIKYDDFDRIYRNFPNADIKTIEGAGHWLHAEKPDEFYETVDDFLRRNEL
jgi:pimeloyl-ACP methyl ester carboxylesterase